MTDKSVKHQQLEKILLFTNAITLLADVECIRSCNEFSCDRVLLAGNLSVKSPCPL